ncbi:hypothetical protein TTHERM_00151410 (macronuclear) [Tetrahymena thermophila SB210]|uniref:Uncharacterized protein n=1 Tax=Tetrahymena thermophila (strain SB210) TaxID=312017 RepID=I7MGG6_TETTS|nr:hypothetical protein TTHERM_00151410 [Tetrahymena thermophila SB210]EAS01431.2 hypothetical protein TTHERM_00151410 [Tetrahymena thermophila SB210]|eukprot:XP_001021677.2 hypothetical protein TTHERM_00151410 [Tetrahymena thermophila SB210]
MVINQLQNYQNSRFTQIFNLYFLYKKQILLFKTTSYLFIDLTFILMKQIKTDKKFNNRPNSPGIQQQKNEELSPFRAHLQMYQQEERVKYNYLMKENSLGNQLYRNDSFQSGASSPQNYRNKIFNFFSKSSGMKQNRSYDKIKQNEQSLNQDIIQKIQDKFNNQLAKCSNDTELSAQQKLNISKLQNLNSVGRSTYYHDFQGSKSFINSRIN